MVWWRVRWMTLGSGSSCLEPHPVWRSASCVCDLSSGNEENIIISDTELFSMLARPVMWACSWCDEFTETSQTSHLMSPVASLARNSAPFS